MRKQFFYINFSEKTVAIYGNNREGEEQEVVLAWIEVKEVFETMKKYAVIAEELSATPKEDSWRLNH